MVVHPNAASLHERQVYYPTGSPSLETAWASDSTATYFVTLMWLAHISELVLPLTAMVQPTEKDPS